MTTGNTILVNDQPLFYRNTGKGMAVVLVHGFGEDGALWDYQVKVLKNKFMCIVPDLPGSGRSPGATEISMEAMASQLNTLLDELQVNECVMIGHSMGGYISLAFAEKYPDRLIGLGLFHSTACADTEEKKSIRRRGIEFIKINGSARFQEQAIPNLFSEAFKKQYPAVVHEIVQQYTNFPEGSLVKYYEAMIQRPDRTDILKNMNKPVLLIIGELDKAVPLQQSLEQCHLPGLSFIQVLRHSAHMGMVEEKETSTCFMERFLYHCDHTLT